MITYEDFKKMELKVGKITEARIVEGTKKLVRLTVDMREIGPRTIVAGIADRYPPSELVGKLIIVVANMQPAVIRGIKSDGMLLAAVSDGEKELSLVTLERPIEPGTRVM